MSRAHPMTALTAVLLFLLGLAGCETVGSVTAPSFSKQQEENMAREAAVECEKKNELWKDPLLDAYVRQIVQRLDRGKAVRKRPRGRRRGWRSARLRGPSRSSTSCTETLRWPTPGLLRLREHSGAGPHQAGGQDRIPRPDRRHRALVRNAPGGFSSRVVQRAA